MSIRASFLLIALSSLMAEAESFREFRSSLGVVRVSVTDTADGSASLRLFTAALQDTSQATVASPSRTDSPDFLLDMAYLERGTSQELRFPVRYSQVHEWLARHAGTYQTGSLDERLVSLVRDLSQSLHVHMKTAAAGGGK